MSVNIPLIEGPWCTEAFPPETDPQLWRMATAMHKDGIVVLDLLDPDFDERAKAIRRNLHERFDWDAWQRNPLDTPRLQDAWVFDENVKAIAGNAQVIALLSRLYGRQAFPFQTLNFPVGTEQHYHSDSFHFSSAPERFMCGVWVALEDVSPDAGPLVYYPGSHKLPIYTNEHLDRVPSIDAGLYTNYELHTRFCEHLVAAHQLEPVEFLPKKGQALIWAANLLHGGATQRNRTLTRWSQVTHYYFENCIYYSPLASIPLLGAVAYREAIDLRTGKLVPQSLNGLPLTDTIRQRLSPYHMSEAREPFLPDDFNDAAYLKLNPDVTAAGVEPKTHYLQYGFREKRAYKM